MIFLIVLLGALAPVFLFKKDRFLRFSSFFFTAALGEFGFCLQGARSGRRRCERPTLRVFFSLFGERF